MSLFQQAVRERFFRHVCDVSAAVGLVVEIEGPDVPGYDEVGYDLQLALEPLVPSRCPLIVSLADVFGQVTLGEALIDYYPYGRWKGTKGSDGTEWVDLIEQDITAAVEGRVKDVSWLRRGRRVHTVTYMRDDFGEWKPIHTRGFPFMTRMFQLLPRFYVRSEMLYLPYVEADAFQH